MPDHRHVRTDRLRLDAVTAADLDDVHALTSDPAVWTHFPSGRHTSPDQTAEQLASFVAAWERDGLGYWTVRLDTDGRFLGVGGCTLRRGCAWNVYYRFAPAAQGSGYAAETVSAAQVAAADVRPDLPVIAYLLEHNVASRRVAERAGLHLAWQGPDVGSPDPGTVRLVFADRPLDADTLESLTT